MKRLSILMIGLMAAMSLSLIACGGGGSGGGSGGGTVDSASSPIRSFGEITQKGSIFVNGVEFETSGALLELDGQAPVLLGADDSMLRVGMLAVVEGTASATSGSAGSIIAEDNVEGPIASVATSASGLVKTVVVLEQTVLVEDGVTVFDNNDPTFDSFAELDATDVGMVIEVTGFVTGDGTIRATFIEKKADDLAAFLGGGDLLEVLGVVENLAPSTFSIGLLTVDYSGAILRNLPSGLANGLLVEAKGSVFDDASNTLTASEVEGKLAGVDDDIAEAKVEGFIAGLNTGARIFLLNGQTISYGGAEFRGGVEADLADGLKVQAEGALSGGMLLADKVAFKESVRFEANADTVGADSLTLEALPGITVMVDDTITQFKNVASVAGVNPGDELKIRARPSGVSATTLVAIELELVDTQSATRLIIQGPVSDFDAGTGIVTILGIDVDTDLIGANNFEIEDVPVTRAQFFAALAIGEIVKARADINPGPSLAWDQIELEIED